MTDEQFDTLIEKLDEIGHNIVSELEIINTRIDELDTRISKLKVSDKITDLLSELKNEVEYIHGKL